jgi:hypothetical protein
MESKPKKYRTSDAITDGFDEDPAPGKVESGKPLYVYRAHGSSKFIGRFFFTPQIAGTPRMNWTADMLERELNAALWENDYRYLAKFRVREKVKYEIGPIAQDGYQGIDKTPWGKDQTFQQDCYFRNQNLFYQVKIEGITESNWREYLELVSDEPIKAGHFHRANRTVDC